MPEYVEEYADLEIDELALTEGNAILEKPINFYGGYLMQMMYKKNEVLTDAVIQRLQSTVSHLQNEIKLRDIDREAVNNVAIMNFDLAQSDADRIKKQA